MFCLPCQNITIESIQQEMGYQHHESLKNLEASSKQCSLCSLIVLAIFKNCGVSDLTITLSEALLKGLPGMEIGQDDAVGLMQHNSLLYIDRRAKGGKRGIGIGRLRMYSDYGRISNVFKTPRAYYYVCLQTHLRLQQASNLEDMSRSTAAPTMPFFRLNNGFKIARRTMRDAIRMLKRTQNYQIGC